MYTRAITFVLVLSFPLVLSADASYIGVAPELPLHFEPAAESSDGQATFRTRTQGYVVRFSPNGVEFLPNTGEGRRTSVRMELVGASESSLQGLDRRVGYSNYFVGERSGWRSRVPHYGKLEWSEVYPGIDFVFYGKGRDLEYDIVVSSGANPADIALRFDGADLLEIDESGSLVMRIGAATFTHRRPRVFQSNPDGGKDLIEGNFAISPDGLISFELSPYDQSSELVIDPVVEFSTFVGADREDNSPSIFVDDQGSIYVLLQTESPSFPTTPGAFDATFGDSSGAVRRDLAVIKMDANASSLIYSTFVGGSGPEQTHCSGHAIRVDDDGYAYVSAETSSRDFPTTSGAFDRTYAGGLDDGRGDAVAFKLSPGGDQLTYSTLLGGSNKEEDVCIDIDTEGTMYLAGQTASTNFPTTTGAYDRMANGIDDIFVTVLRPGGSGRADLLYSTYVGGGNFDADPSISLGIDGVINIFAESLSPNYPTTDNAFDTTHNGGPRDIVVTRIAPDGNGDADLVYSTFFGGSGSDKRDGRSSGLAVGPGGDLFITAETTSTQDDPNPFPVTPGAYMAEHSATLPGGGENRDIFVARLRPARGLTISSTPPLSEGPATTKTRA